MATIYGREVKEFTVKEEWDTDWVSKALMDVQSLKKGDSEYTIVLDNTRFRYDEYGIDFSEKQVVAWGSYRSLQTCVAKLNAMLWSDDDLTEKDNVRGTIPLPTQPIHDKEELRRVMDDLMGRDEFLYGQHLCGSLRLDHLLSAYKTAVGNEPSIIDFDLVGLRSAHRGELCRGEWSRAICHLIEYASRGGIITTMHHWLNPLNPIDDSTWGVVGNVENWNKILTRGTEENAVWHRDLDLAAEVFQVLKDAGVTYMYRPMFEANAGWFWYGMQEGICEDDLIRMWRYLYNYYVNELGLDHMLWVYAPNFTDLKVEEKGSSPYPVTCYYPGDEYCDIVGCDWYTGGDYEIESYIYEGNSYDRLAELGKPVCLAEWGNDGNGKAKHLAGKEFVEVFERMRQEGKRLTHIAVYGGAFGAPYTVGGGEALHDYPYILKLEDMPAYLKSVLG